MKFVELAKVKIQEKRNLVISKFGETITLGQQVIFEEDGKKMGIFLKGAIQVDINKLQDLRDAINEAIEKINL